MEIGVETRQLKRAIYIETMIVCMAIIGLLVMLSYSLNVAREHQTSRPTVQLIPSATTPSSGDQSTTESSTSFLQT